VQIHNDYPGGNIKLVDISNNTIRLEQELRDTTIWWFYWSFCAQNLKPGEYVFEFTNGDVVGPWGPAISHDRITWDWSYSAISRSAFKHTFTDAQKPVYFSFSLPYQLADFDRRISRFAEKIQRRTLVKSEQNRPVPLLLFGSGAGNIFFTARSHACESVAGYVLEGIISYLLTQSDKKLFDDYSFHVIPFIDIDGVENGDQGKCRHPHDHNRDYTDKPVFKSTAALMDYARLHNPDIFIDFHCPGPGFSRYQSGSDRDNYPHFVKGQPSLLKQVEALGKLLGDITQEDSNDGRIVYNPVHDIGMGEDWLMPDEMIGSSCSFFTGLGAGLATIMEVPYFGTKKCVFTQENTFKFGQDFGKAIEKVL
jgi:hypothetical protein